MKRIAVALMVVAFAQKSEAQQELPPEHRVTSATAGACNNSVAPAPAVSVATCQSANTNPSVSTASATAGHLSVSVNQPNGERATAHAVWNDILVACYGGLASNACADPSDIFLGRVNFTFAFVGQMPLRGTADGGHANGNFWSATNFSTNGIDWFDYGLFNDNNGVTYKPLNPEDSFRPAFYDEVFTSRADVTTEMTYLNFGLFLSELGGESNSFFNQDLIDVQFIDQNGVDVSEDITYAFTKSTTVATPEPATLALTFSGLAGLAGFGLRRRKALVSRES